jgi:antirestriction protein
VDFFAGITADDVQLAIDYMMHHSPFPDAEEWRIDDTENFAGFESNSLEKLCQIAALIHQHGEGAVKGYLSHRGADDVDPEEFTDYYIGCFKSEAAFCEEHFAIAESTEAIQVFDWATLDQYIDWESIANDAFINSYYSHAEGHETIHVYVR